jgi:hypothetical protein
VPGFVIDLQVSLKETTCLQEAQEYINNIQLSTPPDQPHLSASGDDEAENQKVCVLTREDCFIV